MLLAAVCIVRCDAFCRFRVHQLRHRRRRVVCLCYIAAGFHAATFSRPRRLLSHFSLGSKLLSYVSCPPAFAVEDEDASAPVSLTINPPPFHTHTTR